MASNLEALVRRLEIAVEKLESAGGIASGSGGATGQPDPSTASPTESSLATSVAAFDELIDTAVTKFVGASEAIGGPVREASKLLEEAFKRERNVVLAISHCKAPTPAEMQALVSPVGEVMMKAGSLTEGKRTDEFQHLKAVADSLQALTWVLYAGKESGMSLPAQHVEETFQAAEFYVNKVLMAYRNKDAQHVEWCKALKAVFLPGLKDYVKQHQTTGPAWKPNGIPISQFKGEAPASTAPPAATRTPPPPPRKAPAPPPTPPAGSLLQPRAAAPAPASGMSALLQDLNKGDAVTSGLRKVTDDMKTKNRTDRTGAVPASAAPPAATPAAASKAAAPAAAAPKFELQQDRKWVVENFNGKKDIVIAETNPRQSVYIYNCKNTVVQVKGKVNNITVDKCNRTGLVFEDVVAACEVVNSTSVEIQSNGVAPTIAIDKVDGCQLYLSAGSLNASITTAKSSEINVLVPGKTAADDLVEHALPEQFVNSFKDGRFVTEPVSHSGG
ncbi:Adenylate cyclase-associated protein [Klebsormidium nitens]|uniref:Adenylate cyclase-associated protein n=1 Tax=Klebsormidium nitens TaxID=105231 RepID=A0A1Y1I1R0_KLENI|nr:Adenylate cyclase-associated protein [Klebsormidium nitens]|eukprot:GAQ84855.1 Adenylate cyclase-associated protein [Klebsormidium nitens]